jgi:hypothetical protein
MRLKNWSIAAAFDNAPTFAGLRLRLLHRAQVDHLAPRANYINLTTRYLSSVVEQRGIEPLTSALRTPRSPN